MSVMLGSYLHIQRAVKGEYRKQWLDAIHKEVDQLLLFRKVLIYDGTTERSWKSKIVLR